MHNKTDYYYTFKIKSYLAMLWQKFDFVKLTIINLEVYIYIRDLHSSGCKYIQRSQWDYFIKGP
jgi:hypothetical protein